MEFGGLIITLSNDEENDHQIFSCVYSACAVFVHKDSEALSYKRQYEQKYEKMIKMMKAWIEDLNPSLYSISLE